MSRRIIEEEKSSELKTEFDKIAMPEASKRRVLKKLESQAPKSQPLPDNLVPDEKSDHTAKPSQASSARTSDTSSEQTDSSYSWGGAKLENDAALYPDEAYTNVKYINCGRGIDESNYMTYCTAVRNGAPYYILSQEFHYDSPQEDVASLAVYRYNNEAEAVTEELYMKDRYDVMTGFTNDGAYIIYRPEGKDNYVLNCYNWNMYLVLSADLSGLKDLPGGLNIGNFGAVFTDGFDSMWLYNNEDDQDNIIYEVIFSDSSGTGVTAQFVEHRINNLQKELGYIAPSSGKPARTPL